MRNSVFFFFAMLASGPDDSCMYCWLATILVISYYLCVVGGRVETVDNEALQKTPYRNLDSSHRDRKNFGKMQVFA